VYCTASVGIALYPQHGLQYGVLLQKSDLALHEAKVRGRGHFRLYAASMGAGTEARLSLESDLRTAVGNDQLRVMYQPQIDLRSGAVVGAEALVRWQHPTEGLLGPDRFIPLAEDLGLVSAIDHWVLEETCAQLRRWHDAGLPPLRVAVNLSGADLGRPDVAASILATIRASGIDPAQIEVEVTETLAMQETQDSRSTLQSLRDQGVGVAIDDFGTGHSSLARLGAFPVDVLKIDKSFIDPVVAAASEAPLVVAIIAMAHSLGLSVVAEGVERIEQLYLLRELGCDRAQGFLLGRPVPAAQFERLVPPVQVPPV
jgi:EAL domain-containing protein (putative c-di-GMP-specific phosphodiesterase class I)